MIIIVIILEYYVYNYIDLKKESISNSYVLKK